MRRMLASLFVAFAAPAFAQTSPLQFDRSATSLDAAGTLTLQTLPMPKGWFSSRDSLDRTKTDLRTTFSIPASGCLPAASGNYTSTIQGKFVPLTNSAGKVDAYEWNMLDYLSPYQNHWHYHVGCDGSRTVDGCQEARTVTLDITAYGSDGQCRTYVDANGVTQCASDEITLSLASVQDPDVVVPAADCQAPDCGIGPCESACAQACDAQYPVNDVPVGKGGNTTDANAGPRLDCKHACPCQCKALRPATCQAPDPECSN